MKSLTVTELTSQIKTSLEGQFQNICVEGEISNLKVHSSGHVYFSLKDKDAQISAAFFRGYASKAPRLPKDGDHVMLLGDISVYPPRGSYQMIVRQVKFVGVGELLLKLYELKEKLSKQGYFDQKFKKPLPAFPKTIGVVTSPTGAVIQDILNVLKRRINGFHLILNPVRVQGEGAAVEIARAIQEFNRHGLCDLIIVGRGGGSLEDLWPFNEEIVARAIFDSQIPVISAVGHETDNSISDLVADVRAPTPSAAAEIAVRERSELLASLDKAKVCIQQNLLRKTSELRSKLEFIQNQPAIKSPHTFLAKWVQLLDESKSRLDREVGYKLESTKNTLKSFNEQLKTLSPKRQVERAKEKLHSLVKHLKAIDPKNLLKKGYTLAFSEKDKSIILSAKEIKQNDKIKTLFHDGSILSEVKWTTQHSKNLSND